MSFLKINEGETIDECLSRNKKESSADIECFKVIEERMSPSGRIEYWSFPLYCELSEEIASGKMLHKAHEACTFKCQDGNVLLSEGFVHSYMNIDDAVNYIERFCVGYTYTRPVIYRCLIPAGTMHYDCITEDADGYEIPVHASIAIRFVEPVMERVNGKTRDYSRMEKLEAKKKSRGFDYDESEITGDVEHYEEDYVG